MTDDALIVYLLRHYRGMKEHYLDHRAEDPEDRYDWTDRLDLEVRLGVGADQRADRAASVHDDPF